MSPPSGTEELEKQLDSILDNYCNSNDVIEYQHPSKQTIQAHLNMDREYIEALPSSSKYSIAIELMQYAMYINRLANRERAREKWANDCIHNLCARAWQDYDSYTKADIKIRLIGQENSTVQKLISVRSHANIRAEELHGMAEYIKGISNLLSRSTYNGDN